MTDTDILDQLTIIFREIFMDDSLVATPEMTADDVERWDSLSHIDMILMVEEHFGIRLPTREITTMKNVGDLVRSVTSKAK